MSLGTITRSPKLISTTPGERSFPDVVLPTGQRPELMLSLAGGSSISVDVVVSTRGCGESSRSLTRCSDWFFLLTDGSNVYYRLHLRLAAFLLPVGLGGSLGAMG